MTRGDGRELGGNPLTLLLMLVVACIGSQARPSDDARHIPKAPIARGASYSKSMPRLQRYKRLVGGIHCQLFTSFKAEDNMQPVLAYACGLCLLRFAWAGRLFSCGRIIGSVEVEVACQCLQDWGRLQSLALCPQLRYGDRKTLRHKEA